MLLASLELGGGRALQMLIANAGGGWRRRVAQFLAAAGQNFLKQRLGLVELVLRKARNPVS